MKKANLRFFQNFKFNSIFVRIFLVLMLLTVISVSIFSLLTARLVSGNLRERTEDTYYALLVKTCDSQDLLLSNLSSIMTNLMRDKNVTGIMVAPNLNDYERNIDAARMISDVCSNNEIVSRAFLYIPSSNTIVTSNRTIEDKQEFDDRNLIKKYLLDYPKLGAITVDGFTTKIIVEGERILLFQDYPASRRIATLVFELNADKLFEVIQGSSDSGKLSIFIYDVEGHPVFPQLAVYPSEETLTNSSKMVFSYVSEKSNWRYLLLADRSTFKFNAKTILTIILPSILLLLVISMGLSAYIIYNIYVPISDLVNSINIPVGVGNSSLKGSSAKNEFDFFKQAYASAVDKSIQLAQLMESVSPAVLQKLFTNLLYGKDIDEKYIRTTFETIGSRWEINDHYMVLVSRQIHKQGINPTDIEIKLYNLSVSQIIHSLLEDKCQCYSIETEDDSQVYILNFNNNCSVINIKSILFAFYKSLNERLENLPYIIAVGRGKVYDHISGIRHSYIEAQKDLSYRAYYSKKQSDILTFDTIDEDSELLDVLYYKETANNMLQSIIDGKTEAHGQFFAFIEDVSRTVKEAETARKVYEAIMETTIEKMISMRINEEDVSLFENKQFSKELNSIDNIHEMNEYIMMFIQKAINLIGNYVKKGRNKHIERSKEYIANNYASSILSLSTLSEYLGLNTYYISHIFNDYLNQRFIDYLNLFRIGKAKQLLDATNLSISDVGFKTGFNSPQNFIRVFKKYTGITPGQYKNKTDGEIGN